MDIQEMTRETFHQLTSEEQRHIYAQIACDIETGNHLLEKRSDAYWKEFNRVADILQTTDRSELDKAIIQFIRECSDYDYYHSLPKEYQLTGK